MRGNSEIDSAVRAWHIRVGGVVQGVGFRPFVFRLAQANTLAGWVLNAEQGVEIYVEGGEQSLTSFVHDLKAQPPPAAQIAVVDIQKGEPLGLQEFTIRESDARHQPSVCISPDLAVCEECLRELFDPEDRRYQYAYINCTNCGPRYSVITRLPYDRSNTTMKAWSLDERCTEEYEDPTDRRFHAQPVACPECGPQYELRWNGKITERDEASIATAAQLLNSGKIVAIKGIGGYHLACDARNSGVVRALRERKFRKEKPFALMASSLDIVGNLVQLSTQAEALLTSPARPIVLAPAKMELPGVAPDSDELGVMLPYAPLHHLLFASGSPDVLVMTSANRSNEPIAFDDDEAQQSLAGIADAFLAGQRPIARRLDDSVVRAGAFGPTILRRSRGHAPAAVTRLPAARPILALGADLKNTITLVVDGQAFVSQHIGDLDHYKCFRTFEQTIEDLVSMYQVRWEDMLVVHDAHPEYLSTLHALEIPAGRRLSVQHHRAHIASVLAEAVVWDQRVLGVSFDGIGYGDDRTIWGGELFIGSLRTGFDRVAHLRPAVLPGGDAAARHPAQAAAGFLSQVRGLPNLSAAPFHFTARFEKSLELVHKGLRTFQTTSMGRLFDAAAALLGFTRSITYEGQAAMWMEHLARRAPLDGSYPFPFSVHEFDYRPLLESIIDDRLRGRTPSEIARAFHRGIAQGLRDAIVALCGVHKIESVVLSGGVFQNQLLLEDLKGLLDSSGLSILTNHAVPPNDGGISLGQAALAALRGIA